MKTNGKREKEKNGMATRSRLFWESGGNTRQTTGRRKSMEKTRAVTFIHSEKGSNEDAFQCVGEGRKGERKKRAAGREPDPHSLKNNKNRS